MTGLPEPVTGLVLAAQAMATRLGIDPDIVSAGLALIQVVMIDIVLASDNAIAIGLAASGLNPSQLKRAISFGLIGAVLIRILFVLLAVQLLKIPGLMLMGGILLIWVGLKTWIDVSRRAPGPVVRQARSNLGAVTGENLAGSEAAADPAPARSLWQAISLIVIADISMSVDNVLAVSGAAHDHIGVLVVGLLLSIGLMGVAAHLIARLIDQLHWIGHIGAIIILIVAGRMIWEGAHEVLILTGCHLDQACLKRIGDMFSHPGQLSH